MTIDALMHNATSAIRRVYGDQTKTKIQTRDRLNDLKETIDLFLEALEKEPEQHQHHDIGGEG